MAGLRPRDESQLAEEQAALRRVATLVAQGAPAEDLFAVVAEQVAEVLRVPVVSIVRYESDNAATERASFSERQGTLFAARIDDYTGLMGVIAETARGAGIRSTVGIPIVVGGHPWGAMIVSSTEPDPLPPDTEAHLAHFTELVATAIANGEASEELERLADEQAALRRVATLVAQDVPSRDLFHAVASEVGALLGADFSGMIRYEDEATVTTMASWAAGGEDPLPIPTNWPMEPGDPATIIAEAREPARVCDWTGLPGRRAAFIRDDMGVSSSVGCPIVVEGRLWGALAVHSKRPEPLPPDTESRLLNFTELVATAIANSNARAEVARLAQEQAALRRVATLVAREASEAEVFTAIAKEIGRLLGTEETRMLRYEDDHSAVVLARWGRFDKVMPMPIGSRFRLEDESATARVFRTGKPARIARAVHRADGDRDRQHGVACASGFATTGSEVRIPRAMGCSDSVTGRRRSAAGSKSRARPAAARW